MRKRIHLKTSTTALRGIDHTIRLYVLIYDWVRLTSDSNNDISTKSSYAYQFHYLDGEMNIIDSSIEFDWYASPHFVYSRALYSDLTVYTLHTCHGISPEEACKIIDIDFNLLNPITGTASIKKDPYQPSDVVISDNAQKYKAEIHKYYLKLKSPRWD